MNRCIRGSADLPAFCPQPLAFGFAGQPRRLSPQGPCRLIGLPSLLGSIGDFWCQTARRFPTPICIWGRNG